MRKPTIDVSIFEQRRKVLAEKIKGSVMILPAHPHYIRNHDVHHDYRPDSNLFYYTGYEEPEAVFVFRPGMTPETVLYVLPKDPLRETWDGFRYGPDYAKECFKIDKCYTISELDTTLPDLISPAEKVYYRTLQNHEFDIIFNKALDSARIKLGRSGLGLKPVVDPTEVIGEQRLIKQPKDLEWQNKACEITAEAHLAAMRFAKPGMNEREIDAFIRYKFMAAGSPRMGYNTIIASGASATTLHYNFNDQQINDGDLVLIDAGTEYNLFTGDITRTFPVNGKFTDAQKRFYNIVLGAQKEILKMIKPGVIFKTLQERTVSLLVDGMFELGLLKNTTKEKAIDLLEYKKYYPHGVSHWLGMDVHDIGAYTVSGESRPLEPGMCFTVEPGLYVPLNDETAPAELRGLGVRIEDNVFVTESGCYNMTSKAPKEIADLESIIGKG